MVGQWRYVSKISAVICMRNSIPCQHFPTKKVFPNPANSMRREVINILPHREPSGIFRGMRATAIVNGKLVSFPLSRGLAASHRRNRGLSMTPVQAVEFVESKRRKRAQRWMATYVEDRG